MTRAPSAAALGGFRFHIAPRPGRWLNDPNGPIFWDGRFHLFHQPHWGHAVSDDLVRWRLLPDALPPTPAGPDRGGAWSGSTVSDGDRVTAIYTGVDETARDQVVCIATATGDLTEWHKEPIPVIASPPEGLDPVGFRDPFVLRHGDRWLCVLGAGVPGRAMALLYSSADLRSWTYEGPMFERAGDADGAEATGEMWECPFLVPVGDRHVLGVSVWYGNEPFHTVAFVGRFDGRRLEPDLLARLDHGPDFYAPTAMVDPAGRTLLWGWSWDPSEPGVGHYDHGGCLTVTREVTLDGDDLRIRPVDKLATLRGERIGLHEGTVTEAAPVTLVEGPAAAFDLAARVDPAPGGRVEVELLASRDGRERTTIFIDRAEGVVGVDTTRSSLAGPGSHAIHIAPFKSDGTVEVRVLRDASLLEVFIEGHPFTVRVCPSSADIAIRLVAARRACRVRAEAWAITEQAIEVAP